MPVDEDADVDANGCDQRNDVLHRDLTRIQVKAGTHGCVVVSGTWWTSTSTVYDERTTYPVHAGTVAVDKLRGIHWDGSRMGEKEPAVLILAGTGPNITQQVDENGKPK